MDPLVIAAEIAGILCGIAVVVGFLIWLARVIGRAWRRRHPAPVPHADAPQEVEDEDQAEIPVSEVVIVPKWQPITFSGGVTGTRSQYPIRTLYLYNRDRTVYDVTVFASTYVGGWAKLLEMSVFPLSEDEPRAFSVPLVPVSRIPIGGQQVTESDQDYGQWTIAQVTVRLEFNTGNPKDTQSLEFLSPDEPLPPDPNDYNVLDSIY